MVEKGSDYYHNKNMTEQGDSPKDPKKLTQPETKQKD